METIIWFVLIGIGISLFITMNKLGKIDDLLVNTFNKVLSIEKELEDMKEKMGMNNYDSNS